MFDLTKQSIADSLYGRKSLAITPDDHNDLPGGPVKAIVLVSDGTVALLPPDNDDADPVVFGWQSVGFTPPFVVRRVLATGTTATVRTVED